MDRRTLAASIEQYHEVVVVPHLKRLDRIILLLTVALAALSGAFFWIVLWP